MAPRANAREAVPGAAVFSDEEIAADITTPAQIFNLDGERLLRRREPIPDAPRLKQPSWYAWASQGGRGVSALALPDRPVWLLNGGQK